MSLTRRQILRVMGASTLFGLPRPGFAASHLTLGDATLTTLSDGHLVLPMDFLLGPLSANDATPILARHGITGNAIEPPCNLTLLQDGERTVLFDAGSGSGFMPSAGKVLEALDALGVAPEDITHVLFTHAHPDHLWGVLDDFDEPTFANASFAIGQAEWDYWTDPETATTIGADRAGFAVGAARRLAVIADRMEFFTGGQEVLPGILVHDTPGHTPGHTAFEIRQGSESVLVVGDAIGNGHLAFERPGWASASDQDVETGITTRLRLLDQLATDQMVMVGFHLPEGGLGRVERAGDAYRFVSEV